MLVSYNTRELTRDCLRSLAGELRGGDRVVVVDNGSADGSAGMVEAEFPAVDLVRAGRNLGFGAANNLGFGRCGVGRGGGEFVLLLNTDTVVRPGAVGAMAGVLRRGPGVGAVGCRLENADGSLQRSCWSFPTPGRAWAEAVGVNRLPLPGVGRDWHRWGHGEERDVDFVIGAALMVRREMIEAVGGFDESFFLYAEETDWQRRMVGAGWRVRFTPAGTVVHLGGGSSAGGGEAGRRQVVEFCRGNARYLRKHHGRAGLASARAAKVLGLAARAGALSVAAALGRPGAGGRARERLAHLRWWAGLGPREGYAELNPPPGGPPGDRRAGDAGGEVEPAGRRAGPKVGADGGAACPSPATP